MKKQQFKEALWDLLLRLDIPTKEKTELHIDAIVNKYFPEKVKKEKVITHSYLGQIDLDEEEFAEFEEDPAYWLKGCDMPDFTFFKGGSPEAEEGEEWFIRLNDNLYSFTIHEGCAVELTYDMSIYETDVKNVKLIPKEEESNYNLTKRGSYGYKFN